MCCSREVPLQTLKDVSCAMQHVLHPDLACGACYPHHSEEVEALCAAVMCTAMPSGWSSCSRNYINFCGPSDVEMSIMVGCGCTLAMLSAARTLQSSAGVDVTAPPPWGLYTWGLQNVPTPWDIQIGCKPPGKPHPCHKQGYMRTVTFWVCKTKRGPPGV